MAGSKIAYGTKVRASTIIEVLIAMVIIVAVFGIAMMIYTNVTQSSLSVKRIRTEAVLNEYLQAAERSFVNTTQSFNVDSLTIEQTVKSYNSEKKLIEIDLVAFDSNEQKVAELHKVIINNNE